MASATKLKQNFAGTLFLTLSIVGFVLLWGVMVYNGTLHALLLTAWKGLFPGGKQLRKSYTGLRPVDFVIAVPVAFFDDQINTADNGTWLMMLNFLTMLHTAALWVFVEAGRKGQTSTMIKS
jgi:hypothetical protein